MYYFLILLFLALAYLILDYRGPREIRLRSASVFGMLCFKASDLIVQEYDHAGNLWATRGMIIYRLPKSGVRFVRIARVNTGLSIYWLFNFSIFRKLTNRPECLEVSVSSTGDICAFAAGYMLYGTTDCMKFRRTLKLPHFGFGTGRGLLSNGLLRVNNKILFLGEYFRNEERSSVQLFISRNSGRSWDIAHRFQPGSIRHIHGLFKDPFKDIIWICTGDEDHESRIGWSNDDFRTINFIGQGSQVCRSCHLAFSEDFIYWGTDTGSVNHSGIYRWSRKQQQIDRLAEVDGALLSGARLAQGTIVMGTDREGFPNEQDDKTRLLVIQTQYKIKRIEGGTWNNKRHGLRFGFAKLRFQRNQGNDTLAISILNQKEIPDASLILVSEEEINRKACG
jgi:hypothetical protein